jgi:uncharacterized lipoprotein
MKLINTLTFIAVLIFTTGCALTTESIDIPYNLIQGVSKISGADHIAVVVTVNDNRPDKTRISNRVNEFDVEKAPFVTNQAVDFTIRHAVEQELKIRGFNVAQKSPLEIEIDISRFFNNYKANFYSSIAMSNFQIDVIVKSNSTKQIFHRQISTQGIEVSSFMTAENASLALSQALKNGIETLFGDSAFISALLSSNQ